MKDKKLLYFILMFLPLLITAVAVGFLPDRIPAHYGFGGQADRWGSKYESFLFPAITVGMGLFMLAMARIASRQEPNGRNNEKVCMTVQCHELLYTVHVFYTGGESQRAVA